MSEQLASPTAAHARLRLRHLQLLDILGRTRNLRLAAEQLHVTQPAATKILLDVEALLGARLFERLPREMRPTELGRFALDYAAATLARHAQFSEEFEALRRGGHGHVTVGAISGAAAQLLTAAVKEIHRRRPRLVLRILEQSSDQLLAWLGERKIDLMLGRFTEGWQAERFRYERLAEEPLWVVARHGHALQAQPPGHIAALADWPWILYPRPTALRRVCDALFDAAGLRPAAGLVETPSFLSAFELLQATDMLSLQPAAIVEKYVRQGLLARIDVALPQRMPDYGLVTRLDETPAPAVQAFIDVLREVAGVTAP